MDIYRDFSLNVALAYLLFLPESSDVWVWHRHLSSGRRMANDDFVTPMS